MKLTAVIAVICASAGTASAQVADAGDQAAPVVGHKQQFGVGLQVGTGFRGIVTYDEEYCGELNDDGTNRSTCLGRSPITLGIVGSYGITDGLEVILEVGVGLESDFGIAANVGGGPTLVALSPGFKAYFAEIGAAQIFSTIQFVVDFADYDQVPGNDYAVRNINGFQFDFHRTFGGYIYFGESVGWNRWLSFSVEAGLGIQARFP